jgi:hypothetical protein
MKNILLADNRSGLLATLEPILKHWGYRVLSTQKAEQVTIFLQGSEPCLLVMGEQILSDPALNLDHDATNKITSGLLPMVALKQDGAGLLNVPPDEILDVPFELFELYSFIQRKVENHPRQNLRLSLRLPGMYKMKDEAFTLAEVLNLSLCGLFFKSAARVEKGSRITVVFPLLGHGKEIEAVSTVLYTIKPGVGNNFSQGFGVGFDEISQGHRQQLRQYIKEHFLKEVSASCYGVGGFAAEQLKGGVFHPGKESQTGLSQRQTTEH